MRIKQRVEGIIAYFQQAMPVAESELNYENPFQLLVAVILSAQCTDKRVNLTTPALLEAYPTPESMAQASEEDIFHYIRSISYPNNKARHLAGMARMLVEEFGGEVPSDLKELQRLPGIGRRTALRLAMHILKMDVDAADSLSQSIARYLSSLPEIQISVSARKVEAANAPKSRSCAP